MDGIKTDISAYETGPSPDFDEFDITDPANTAVTQTVGSGPTVTVSGTPAVNGNFRIKIDLGGARGTATFTWSKDGGSSWEAAGVATAATVVLGSTGLTAAFAVGTYVLNDEYSWTSSGVGELDISSLGGYPVRRVDVIDNGTTGVLHMRTARSRGTDRVATALIDGSVIDQLQITSIRGKSDGSTVARLRIYK